MKREDVTELLVQHHFAPATARALMAEMPDEAEPAVYAKRLMDAGDDRHLDLPGPVIDWAREVRAAAAKQLPDNLQVTQNEIAPKLTAEQVAAIEEHVGETILDRPLSPEDAAVTVSGEFTPEEIARLNQMTAGGVVEIEPAPKKRRGKKVDA